MGLNADHLRAAAQAAAAAAERAADELNAADGALGDGDLGVTVANGWRAAAEDLAAAPDDLGQAFLAAAKAFQRVSSSSFGTLTATALMSAAKATKGRTEVEWSEIGVLLAGATEAMAARGKGRLGDKSVLDILDAAAQAATQAAAQAGTLAAARAAEGPDAPTDLLAAVDAAADACLARFRDKPNKLGRARMFGEKSIGLDDPGMLAFRRLLDGLKAGG